MEDNQVKKFDRIRGGLHDVALFTKPSTIQNIQAITGQSETYIVETARYEDQGDTIFITVVDSDGVTRVALPPKVSAVIHSQADSLTSRRRSAASRRTAQARKDRGEAPAFVNALPAPGTRPRKKVRNG